MHDFANFNRVYKRGYPLMRVVPKCKATAWLAASKTLASKNFLTIALSTSTTHPPKPPDGVASSNSHAAAVSSRGAAERQRLGQHRKPTGQPAACKAMAKKKKKGKKAKSPPKPDKSAQLSDEEQAAQAEATRLAARKADAEAAAAAADAAQKALDALPKGVLATALARRPRPQDSQGPRVTAHEQHHSKKTKKEGRHSRERSEII